MKQQKTVKIILTILIASSILSGCGILSENKDNINHEKVTREQSEIIMEAVLNEDVDAIAELFCPYVKENHPELESEIQELFAFIDGEIISYDEPKTNVGFGKTESGQGVVEQSMSGITKNIKTDTGKTYFLVFGSHTVFKDHPEYVGITNISIRDSELYDADMEYPNIAEYKISSPEMWE